MGRLEVIHQEGKGVSGKQRMCWIIYDNDEDDEAIVDEEMDGALCVRHLSEEFNNLKL